MDKRISFVVSAGLTDPHFRVDFAPGADRLEVMFGGPTTSDEPANILYLFFQNPYRVLDLGRELVLAGKQFVVDYERRAQDMEDSGDVEGCPVPHVKGANGPAESGPGVGGGSGSDV